MSSYVLDKMGKSIIASDFNDVDWNAYKENYIIGEILMPCCGAAAVPKTSPNFLKFFAHYSNECTTSPESQWHIKTKELVITELNNLGITSFLEKSGNSSSGSWKADVYFEIKNNKFAIEIQHSYQRLIDYKKRQARYKESDIQCYWILFEPRYNTITKSIAKQKLKDEFNGKIPENGFFPCIPDLPLVYFDTQTNPPMIKSAALFSCSLRDFINSITSDSFKYEEKQGIWTMVKT